MLSICLGEIEHAQVRAIKALVVDDDAVYQNLLCRLLGSRGIKVVGRATSLQQGVLLYKATKPDVVLVGVSSINRASLMALSTIKEVDPLAKVIVLSIVNSFEEIELPEPNLIDAHILKGSSANDIVTTIKELVAHDAG